jgi:hypothetical protein
MKLRPGLLLLVPLFAAALPVFGEPTVLFEDDFQDLSRWSAPTNQLDGVRMIHTTDANAEAIFGEAGNPYLRLFKGTSESVNMALTGANILSSPSPVITIAFDFWNSSVGNGVIVLRPGKGTVANTGRTHEIRFGRGQLAGVNSIYETNRHYRIEIVLNNSAETVSYGGFYSVAPDRFDVWLDGVRVLNDHTYGRPDPTVATNMQIGEAYTSMQWAAFTNNWGELLVDNLVVYEGAVATPASATPVPVLSHGFDTLAPFGPGTNQLAGERVVEVTTENAETYFGEAGNPYLRFFKQDEADNISMLTTANNVITSPVVTVSFDFWENSAVGLGSGINFRAGTGATVPNASRVYDIAFRKGRLNDVDDLYQTDRRHNIQIVYNNSLLPVTYGGGAHVLASDAMDVWIDGRLALKDNTFNRGQLAVGAAIQSFQFVAFGANEGEFFFDNFMVYDLPYVIIAADDLPVPEVVNFSEQAGTFSLSFTTEAGYQYAVEYSNDLVTWQTLSTILGDGQVQVATNPVSGVNRRFYRVSVSRP